MIEKAEQNAKLSAEIMRIHMYEKQYKDLLGFASSVEEKQEKENVRLREALKTIASENGVSEGYQYADQVANDLISTAKSALEETK